MNSLQLTPSKSCILGLTLLVLLSATAQISAADPAFVGSLALAVDPDGIEALDLSPDTVEKLQELIKQRENEVLKLRREIRDLPPAEIAKRLEPFVAESERLGMELLTLEQRAKLNQLKVARGGMSTLQDPEVSRVLNLDDQQRQQVSELIQQRAKDMTVGGENQRRVTHAVYERKLAALLTAEQRASWEKLAGFGPGTLDASVAEDGDADEGQVADSNPAEGGREQRAAAAIQPAQDAQDGQGASELPDSESPDSEAAGDDGEVGADTAAARRAPDDGLLTFSFRQAKWEDVIDWFAENAALAKQIDEYPEGTFSYEDEHRYTPAEALDILNSVLLNKGYTLVRRNRMLMLLDRAQGIPPELVHLVDVGELDVRSEFELAKCVFSLARMAPEDAKTEVTELLSPGETAVVLPQSRQLLVTATVGKLRVIRNVIESVENPDGVARKVRQWKLKFVLADDILEIARPLLGLPEGENTNEQINISTDSYRTRIFATGTQASLDILDEVVREGDIEATAAEQNSTTPSEQPELRSYVVQKADIDVVFQILQQLLAGLPDARMTLDKTSSKIIILARPTDHELVGRTIQNLEGEARHVEVIHLIRADAQMVVLAINKLFGTTGEGANPNGMRVDADPTSGQIIVYGTEQEVAQVRSLVEKMEGPTLPGQKNVRLIPLNDDQLQSVLPQIEALWPQFSKARIRMVVPNEPGTGSRRFRERQVTPDASANPQTEADEPGDEPQPDPRNQRSRRPANNARPDASSRPPLKANSLDEAHHDGALGNVPVEFIPEYGVLILQGNQHTGGRTQQGASRTAQADSIQFVSTVAQQDDADDVQPAEQPADAPAPADENATDNEVDGVSVNESESAPAAATETEEDEPLSEDNANFSSTTETELQPPANDQNAPAAEPVPLEEDSEVIVTMTPNGLLVTSDNPEALDRFESLMNLLVQQQGAGGLIKKDVAIYYLRYVEAEVAANLLKDILGGTSSSGGASITDMASNLLSGTAGGIFGALMGGGGGGGAGSQAGPITAGNVSIIADPRLNRLIVQGEARELDEIEEILQVLDKGESIIDILTDGSPHVIYLKYAAADKVAQIIQSAYTDRVAGGQGQQQQPTPQDLFRMLRGGQGNSEQQSRGELPKMTVTVDADNNAIIVRAPDSLVNEIKELVTVLDQPNSELSESIEVVALDSNGSLLYNALRSLTSQTGTAAAPSSTSGRPGGQQGQNMDDAMRQIQRFREFQQQMGGGRGFGGGGGGGPFGGGGRGFGGGGGGGPFGGGQGGFGGGGGQGGGGRGGNR